MFQSRIFYRMNLALISVLIVSCSPAYKDSEPGPVAQAVSLRGENLYSAEPSDAALEKYETAKKAYERNPDDVDALIWYGRRAAYLGDYRRAIEIYTLGIERYPDEARIFRHRGHRYISIREFDKAIEDLKRAAALIEGTEDTIEPDGMPNAQNIPVSSLHTNIWYHLGLAYYLNNDPGNALISYRRGIEASRNDDMRTAFTHWLYMTLRLLGRADEAAESLGPIHAGMTIIENDAYHKLCLFYKGELNLEDLADPELGAIMNDAVAYGVGCWHFANGDKDQAKTVFEEILGRESWASFGYIAAEADYVRAFR